MTIGEKIAHLRISSHISQETLAEKLNVPRQSLSEWELGEAMPQLDKIALLCTVFGVSSDELLLNDLSLSQRDEVKINKADSEIKNKYFGTDGFRGEANVDLTSYQAYRVGRFIGWYYNKIGKANKKARILIGKDTRRSSYMLEYSIIAGITASGADAYMLHVTTTPSVSYITRCDEFDCGVMITASHNPFYDNGIKILNRSGEKLDDNTASLIEAYIDGEMSRAGVDGEDIPFATREKVGSIVDYTAGRNRYIGYLISIASHSYKSLRIGLDCANGSSWSIAKAVFDALGAQLYLTGCSPDGLNINNGVGSTHIEHLSDLVIKNHLDIGFAFDGDADRCIAVDEKGKVIDGDMIMYILARRLKERDALDHNKIVATVMSNKGLTNALSDEGIEYELTSVGDRFVFDCMQRNGYVLGGEQSGHIIIKKYATTGDGILTALMVTEEMCDKKTHLSALVKNITLYPQLTESVYVQNKDDVINDTDVKACVDKIEKALGKNGRILLRKSGTEPVIRIMSECKNESECKKYIDEIKEVIRKKGYLCE